MTALGFVLAAVVIATVSVFARADGATGQGGHVHLWPLAHPFQGIAVAAALIVVAGQYGLRRPGARTATQIAGTLVAVIALGLGTIGFLFGDRFPAPPVLATSADLQVVSYRLPGLLGSGEVVLRLRSRDGLASREAERDIACFAVPSSGAGPEWLFGGAEFTGPDEVAVHARDGSTWQIRVDPRTLTAPEPLDRCSRAPDVLGD